MKDMPALLLAGLSKRNSDLMDRAFDRVVHSSRMLRSFVQILRSGATGRKSLGPAPKRCVRRWLDQRADAAFLAASVGQAPSVVDVIRMVHPKPRTAGREAAAAIVRRNPRTEMLPFEQSVVDLQLWPRDSVMTNAERLASVGDTVTVVEFRDQSRRDCVTSTSWNGDPVPEITLSGRARSRRTYNDVAELITIDGSFGEGGGQILRTSIALSLVTGKPFRIENIRAGRKKPGLLRQHLTAVQAATAISQARATGAELNSTALTFEPSALRGGNYTLAVGTAGSATLVFQTILPALLFAREGSRVTLEGGTHNPNAPPFDFLAQTFVPLLQRMGASVQVRLEAHGFYPAGGGRFVAEVEPCAGLGELALIGRGSTCVRAKALVASLPATIGKRELTVVRERLGLDRSACRVHEVDSSVAPGNALMIAIESEAIVEIVTGFGVKGVSAEKVATDACDEAARYLATNVPVGVHLADQLLIPMALGRGGSVRTLTPTSHTTTNVEVIRRFLDVPIRLEQESGDVWQVSVGSN